MITPRPLAPGARVALVSASTAVPEERLAPALEAVRTLGLEPILYPSCFYANRHGYFAEDDQQRAADINSVFADSSIDGVLAIRGGYGANRILPLLDLDQIARQPKLFCGYSDVTALHMVLNQRCGLATFHTVMPATEYYKTVDHYTMHYLRRALFGGLFGAMPFPEGWNVETLSSGRVTAQLCGGNLSLVAASLGTPWEIDTRGKILFLEDVGERNYRIDGLLTHLRNAGKLDDCAGLLLGYWTSCTPEFPDCVLTLDEIMEELVLPAGKPVLGNIPCGHSLPSMSLPLGALVTMDADRKTLEVVKTA